MNTSLLSLCFVWKFEQVFLHLNIIAFEVKKYLRQWRRLRGWVDGGAGFMLRRWRRLWRWRGRRQPFTQLVKIFRFLIYSTVNRLLY